jgi:hypothetical protein
MLEFIQKRWGMIALALLVFILLSNLVWPGMALPGLSAVLITGSLVVGILGAARPHWQAHREGQIDRKTAVRKTLVSIFWIVLTFAAVIVAGMLAARPAGTAAARAAEGQWPGTGSIFGVIVGLLAGFGVGFSVGLLMKWLQGLFTESKWGRWKFIQ